MLKYTGSLLERSKKKLMMAMEEVCQNFCILLNLELVPPPMTSDSITFSINGQANVSHKKEWLCFQSFKCKVHSFRGSAFQLPWNINNSIYESWLHGWYIILFSLIFNTKRKGTRIWATVKKKTWWNRPHHEIRCYISINNKSNLSVVGTWSGVFCHCKISMLTRITVVEHVCWAHTSMKSIFLITKSVFRSPRYACFLKNGSWINQFICPS